MLIYVKRKSVKKTWYKLLQEVLKDGIEIKTEYDNEYTLLSKDVTAAIEITEPFSDPIIKNNGKKLLINTKYGNTYSLYGSLADTILIMSIKSGYIEEIIDGYSDHLIRDNNLGLSYTYHDRLFKYRPKSTSWFKINQIELAIKKLKKYPYTRRAQAITWKPVEDPGRSDPPCLQRIWLRIINNKLSMQTCWRSRDLLKAWEANVNGMIQLQKKIANKLNVEIGDYIEFINSLHIYGNDIIKAKKLLEKIKIREGDKYFD